MFSSGIIYDPKNKKVIQNGYDPFFAGKSEVIMSLGNGYFGQRAADEERPFSAKPGCFVNGTFNKSLPDEVTELPNIPDVTIWRARIDGEIVLLQGHNFSDYRKSLCYENGLLERSYVYRTASGKHVRMSYRRFVSLANLNCAVYELAVHELSGAPFTFELTTAIDGEVTNTGAMHFNDTGKRVHDYVTLEYSPKTTESQIALSQFVTFAGVVDGKKIEKQQIALSCDRRRIAMTAKVKVLKDAVFHKFHTLNTSIFFDSTSLDLKVLSSDAAVDWTREECLKMNKELVKRGFEKELALSTDAWHKQVWQIRKVDITSSDPNDQAVVDLATYHANILTPRHDNRLGAAAKGLSGEGYKGHSFWDTEVFIAAMFTLVDPEQAKKLLIYRYLGLHGARQKAKENNFSGAMFPWEAAWPSYGEVTPLWGGINVVTGEPTRIWTGSLEQHIIADIAYATFQYHQMTGDDDFMKEYGYELLLDTATFWAYRATKNEVTGKYSINNVIGPNEYKEHINNNSFTNYLAKWNLKLAIDFYDRKDPDIVKIVEKLKIGRSTVSLWHDVAANLHIEEPDSNGIIAENDSFMSLPDVPDMPKYKGTVGLIMEHFNIEQINSMRVCKQADVLLLFLLLGDHFVQDHLKLRNFDFYEPITTHDSSLSYTTHSILAADLKLPSAYSFFKKATEIDFGSNMRSSDAGIHAASVAGLIQISINGFGGVRLLGHKLRIEPNLPKEWSELKFDFKYRGGTVHEHVTANSLSLLYDGSQTVEFLHGGKTMKLVPNQKLTISLI